MAWPERAVGVVLAHADVVALLRRIVEPYNMAQLSVEAVAARTAAGRSSGHP